PRVLAFVTTRAPSLSLDARPCAGWRVRGPGQAVIPHHAGIQRRSHSLLRLPTRWSKHKLLGSALSLGRASPSHAHHESARPRTQRARALAIRVGRSSLLWLRLVDRLLRLI